MHCTSQYTKNTNNILSNYLIFHIFGAFSSKKYHFSPKSPEFRRKVAEFRPKVAEFHPEFPEFHFSNLNSPSVRKTRNSAEFRPKFRYRTRPGFVLKTKR